MIVDVALVPCVQSLITVSWNFFFCFIALLVYTNWLDCYTASSQLYVKFKSIASIAAMPFMKIESFLPFCTFLPKARKFVFKKHIFAKDKMSCLEWIIFLRFNIKKYLGNLIIIGRYVVCFRNTKYLVFNKKTQFQQNVISCPWQSMR